MATPSQKSTAAAQRPPSGNRTQLLLWSELSGDWASQCDERPQEESREYLSNQILTYLGNKRALLRFLGKGVGIVQKAVGGRPLVFWDAFSGSGIVSRFMKQYSSLVIASDLEQYSEIVNRCYLTNKGNVDWQDFEKVFIEWDQATRSHLKPGMICELYAPQDEGNIQPGERVFYTRENAMMLDTAREMLDSIAPPEYFNLLLAPLLSEASIHANTSGVFKGFYKNRAGIGTFGGEGKNALQRICSPVVLQKPVLSNFDCDSMVLRGDANEIAKTLPAVDLAYFDPPYNQHPYGSNYFMLNLIAENKRPEDISKVSGIPKNWNHSSYNRKKDAEHAFFRLLSDAPARFLMISYNSEGFIKQESFMHHLGQLGKVTKLETEYNTFRGSRNLRARSLTVTEYLFLVEKT